MPANPSMTTSTAEKSWRSLPSDPTHSIAFRSQSNAAEVLPGPSRVTPSEIPKSLASTTIADAVGVIWRTVPPPITLWPLLMTEMGDEIRKV